MHLLQVTMKARLGVLIPLLACGVASATPVTVRIDLQYVNTLEGFEAVDGMECARIGARMTGTISGSGNQMGQDVTFTGTTKGQDVYHFAVKEGVFVKAVSESTAEIAVDVPAAGMSIPMTQSTKGEVKLAAKN